MLCTKTWEQKFTKDFATWQEWIDFVNSNYKYTIANSTLTDFIGRVHHCELPSYHLYYREPRRKQEWLEINALIDIPGKEDIVNSMKKVYQKEHGISFEDSPY